MSTIHNICHTCFISVRRGFTFTGVIPVGPLMRTAECPHALGRVVRLSQTELSEDVEIVFDGSSLVVREPLWVMLRLHLLDALQGLEGIEVTQLPDGVLEIPLSDNLSLILQPVVDHISQQSGCLLASCIYDADAENPTEARRQIWAMNSALGETSLVLGTRRDLFPLDDPRWTVIYRRFIPTERITRANLMRLVAWAQKTSLYVNEALNFFGFTRGAIRFLRNLKMQAPADTSFERVDTGGFVRTGSLTGINGVSRRALDSYTSDDEAIGLEHLESRILEFLRALDLDAKELEAGYAAHRFTFHVQDCPILVKLTQDERDTFISVSAPIARSRILDDNLATILSETPLLMGDFVLTPASDDGGYELRMQDVILGNDLNVDELAKVLTNITHQALDLRKAHPEIVSERSRNGADLSSLVSFVDKRASRRRRVPIMPRVRNRLSELFSALELFPTLTPSGDFELRYSGIPITLSLSLSPTEQDCYLTVRGHLVRDASNLSPLAIWKAIAPYTTQSHLGGFRVFQGSLTFEDTILGNSLDLNELARTLSEVSAVSSRLYSKIRAQLGLPAVENKNPDGSRRRRAIDGLAVAYRDSGDEEERLRIVRALSMFNDDNAQSCLLDALQDPAPEVAEYAACALAACLYEEQHELCDSVSSVALDNALSDPTRRLACRVLAAAVGESTFPAVRALDAIACGKSETPQLRAYALDALGALGSHQAVNAIVNCVTEIPHAVSHAALVAMVSLDLPDPAPLFLAAQEAYNRVALGEDPDASTIYRTCAQLGMQESVIELVDTTWQTSTEAALGLATACATVQPRRLDILKTMLEHKRGEFRRMAYVAIGANKVVKLADTVASCLSKEPDLRLQGIALGTLLQLGKHNDDIEGVILACSETPHLRLQALTTLHELRKVATP